MPLNFRVALPSPGPADKSREIMIGDTLHEIDGVNVFQKPLCMLSSILHLLLQIFIFASSEISPSVQFSLKYSSFMHYMHFS
jgi:hypothetical protein